MVEMVGLGKDISRAERIKKLIQAVIGTVVLKWDFEGKIKNNVIDMLLKGSQNTWYSETENQSRLMKYFSNNVN